MVVPGATLHGGLSCFHGTKPPVPTPFHRNAPSTFHIVTRKRDTVSYKHVPSRHISLIRFQISTHNYDSTEAGTSVCPQPVPGELLIPDGNCQSPNSQKHPKVTTMSHTRSAALATLFPLSTSLQLTGQVQGVETPLCGQLGRLQKQTYLCNKFPVLS